MINAAHNPGGTGHCGPDWVVIGLPRRVGCSAGKTLEADGILRLAREMY
jgi:hypothetical protein